MDINSVNRLMPDDKICYKFNWTIILIEKSTFTSTILCLLGNCQKMVFRPLCLNSWKEVLFKASETSLLTARKSQKNAFFSAENGAKCGSWSQKGTWKLLNKDKVRNCKLPLTLPKKHTRVQISGKDLEGFFL